MKPTGILVSLWDIFPGYTLFDKFPVWCYSKHTANDRKWEIL